MKTLKINNTLFKGQYAEAMEDLQKGYNVTVRSFTNGGWEATTKVSRFIDLLKSAKVNYANLGNGSLRSTNIRLN